MNGSLMSFARARAHDLGFRRTSGYIRMLIERDRQRLAGPPAQQKKGRRPPNLADILLTERP